jgi:hypothetical protein
MNAAERGVVNLLGHARRGGGGGGPTDITGSVTIWQRLPWRVWACYPTKLKKHECLLVKHVDFQR